MWQILPPGTTAKLPPSYIYHSQIGEAMTWLPNSFKIMEILFIDIGLTRNTSLEDQGFQHFVLATRVKTRQKYQYKNIETKSRIGKISVEFRRIRQRYWQKNKEKQGEADSRQMDSESGFIRQTDSLYIEHGLSSGSKLALSTTIFSLDFCQNFLYLQGPVHRPYAIKHILSH